MRAIVLGIALAVCSSAGAFAQGCVTFSGAEFATLLDSPAFTITGLVLQPDGSYTAVTGPIIQPFTFLNIQPDFQNYIGGCTPPPSTKTPPSISLSPPVAGTALQVVVFAPFGSPVAPVPGAAFTGTASPEPHIKAGALKSDVGTVSQYPVPNGVATVDAADFNHDGILDLAVVYTGSGANPGGVAILLGNANGSFQSAVNYSAGANSLHAAIADFNGDGNPDIAVAADTGTVTILLGNPNGTLNAGIPISLGDHGPVSVLAADFNKDGILDLATANEDGTVSIMLGNGDGTFQPYRLFPAGTDCVYLAAADFNNDGNLDLAVTNFQAGVVAVLLGKGDGSFSAPALYNSTQAPTGLIITGFNGDGRLDIVVGSGSSDVITPNFGSGQISVLLGNGDGTFQGGLYPVGGPPQSIAAGDLNGDGTPDLVTANPTSGSLSILLNQGDGTFQAASSFAPSTSGSFNPSSVTITDLNGDGKLEHFPIEG